MEGRRRGRRGGKDEKGSIPECSASLSRRAAFMMSCTDLPCHACGIWNGS